MTSTHPPQHALIEAAAQEAYRQTADFYGISAGDIHRMPHCRPVTGYMSDILREAGIEFDLVSRGGVVDEHRYFDLDKHGDLIADPTWQQPLLVPRAHLADDLPSVFIGSREHLQDLAGLHGASAEAIKIWDRDGPGRVMTPQERIAAAIDQQMP